MEVTTITLQGDDVDQFAAELLQRKASQADSLNKRGVRNLHKYEGDGFTQFSYERGSAYENSWLMVTVLVELVDDRRCTVAVFVGGGGEGPFKLEEFTLRRFRDSETFGERGRFGTVLKDVEAVRESLGLQVEATT
ncbi:hypothetical protein VB773_11170 [Haloarculaceae archaeon H-GB2-1]|nr:hypothetical protein [Haloarculaceae archaeon H-GB1-1]MEA5386549.1 hypothetical protein [Haloarculaceae archaeon H-GB11]MEA5408061.1 hypothetical protein [Haloarculaceae archaeon H-GB2-1]